MTVCNTQSGGKGRGNNKWVSPKGCLLFSFISEITANKIKCLPTMQYVISMAVVDAILSLTNHQIQLQLKWPNDIYYNNLKIGGVLCQSVYDANSKKYVITSGVGLNVNNKEPTICINDIIKNAADIEEKSKDENKEKLKGLVLSREQILSRFVNIFECTFEELLQNGFGALKGKYIKYWMHSGQKVTVNEDGNTKSQIEMFIIGISDNGQLLGQNASGDLFELHPDGNSFDFLQGLICKKSN